MEEMKREFEEKFYLWKQLRIDGTFESCNDELWNWFESKLNQEIESAKGEGFNAGCDYMANLYEGKIDNPSPEVREK